MTLSVKGGPSLCKDTTTSQETHESVVVYLIRVGELQTKARIDNYYYFKELKSVDV